MNPSALRPHLPLRRGSAAACAALVLTLGAAPAQALDIVFDYSLDTSNFFANAARVSVLEAAAQVYESRLQDSLTAITSGGGNSFDIRVTNPSNLAAVAPIDGASIAAGEIRIYVGGTLHAGTTLAVGGPGGWTGSATSQAFFDNITSRGQPGALGTPATDFAPWGGLLSFDLDTNWYADTDTTTTESFSGFDLYSVAVHEIAHVLGYGTADSWNARVTGSTFNGSAAGVQPLVSAADDAHWSSATVSDVNGVAQQPAMSPSIAPGQRKYFTTLDYAGLSDIGWQVSPVPEPATVALWAAGLGLFGLRRLGRRPADGRA